MRTNRIIFTLAAAVAASTIVVRAQTIDFNQNRTFQTTADRKVYCVGVPVVGTNFVALLYYEATEGATSLTPVAQFNRFRNVAVTDPLAGTWVGATRTLTGRMTGDNVTLQVVVWDMNAGATFDQARAAGGWWAESATFTYTVPAPGSLPSAFYIENFRGFSTIGVPCIPEPSIIALVAVGSLGMIIFIRCRPTKGLWRWRHDRAGAL